MRKITKVFLFFYFLGWWIVTTSYKPSKGFVICMFEDVKSEVRVPYEHKAGGYQSMLEGMENKAAGCLFNALKTATYNLNCYYFYRSEDVTKRKKSKTVYDGFNDVVE